MSITETPLIILSVLTNFNGFLENLFFNFIITVGVVFKTKATVDI